MVTLGAILVIVRGTSRAGEPQAATALDAPV
jgi:hypothetical protein